MDIYDRPDVRLRLKVRLLKAEVIERGERGEGGSGGASCPRDLRSGSGHRRLEACGLSNGRQKLA